MSGKAYLINHPNDNDKFICNICSSPIRENIIGLKCNSKKHIFCYECINDWYYEIKDNMKSVKTNYNFIRMCPICRKNGGYLPCLNTKHINQIHYKGDIISTCGYKLKGKNDYCMNIGKKCYNNLCKKHYDIDTKKNNLNINDVKLKKSTNKNTCKKVVNDTRTNELVEDVTNMLKNHNIFINIDDTNKINIIK